MADLRLILHQLIAPSDGLSELFFYLWMISFDIFEHIGNFFDFCFNKVPILRECDIFGEFVINTNVIVLVSFGDGFQRQAFFF
jgi:hypothetical protein